MMELFYILMGVVVTGICTYVNIHRNVYLLPPSPPPRKFYCMIIKNKTKPQASLAEPFTLLPLLKCRNFTLPCFYLMLSLNFFTHSVTHSETFIGNFPGMKHFAWFWELKDEWEHYGSCFQGIHSCGWETDTQEAHPPVKWEVEGWGY